MLFLEPEEVAHLAETIDPRYRVLVYTAAYTGLRAGELLALRRRDVDLLRGVVHVERSLKEVHSSHLAPELKGLFLGPTKTHTRRTVALPRFLREMLNEHLSDPEALASGSGRTRSYSRVRTAKRCDTTSSISGGSSRPSGRRSRTRPASASTTSVTRAPLYSQRKALTRSWSRNALGTPRSRSPSTGTRTSSRCRRSACGCA